jgi:hypothetical protein
MTILSKRRKTMPQARIPDGTLPVRKLRGRRRAKYRAHTGGYFWMPCVTCGQMSGGHEWETHRYGGSSVPRCPPLFPDDKPHRSVGICPACAEAGVGTLWKLVAPPGHMVSYDGDELVGPYADLVIAKLRSGTAAQRPEEP